MFTTFRLPTSSSKHSEYSAFPPSPAPALSLSHSSDSLRARDGGQNYPHTTHQLTIGETDFCEHRPGWMRRGARDGDHAWVSSIPQFWHIGLLVTTRSSTRIQVMHADFVAMLSSCRVTGSASSARIFIFLISAFKRLVTSRPTLLEVCADARCGYSCE